MPRPRAGVFVFPVSYWLKYPGVRGSAPALSTLLPLVMLTFAVCANVMTLAIHKPDAIHTSDFRVSRPD